MLYYGGAPLRLTIAIERFIKKKSDVVLDFPADFHGVAMITELADDSVEGSRDELDFDDGSHAGRG